MCGFSAVQRVCTPHPRHCAGSAVIRFRFQVGAGMIPEWRRAPAAASHGVWRSLRCQLTRGPAAVSLAPPGQSSPCVSCVQLPEAFSSGVRIIARVHCFVKDCCWSYSSSVRLSSHQLFSTLSCSLYKEGGPGVYFFPLFI